MNRMDHNSFKSLVEGVNTVITKNNTKEEINEELLKNCISSINDQFLNEGIELSEEQLQELAAGIWAGAKHLFSGKLKGIRDVMSQAEQDASQAHIEKHAAKRFARAQKAAKDRADFLFKTGDSADTDREYAELKGTAQRRGNDLTHATQSKRTADAPRLGGKARKDAAQTRADLATSRQDVARVTGERDEARTQERVGRVQRRGMRIGAANKGDAKQQKHLAGVVTRAGVDASKYKVKGVHKKTGKYILGGKGVPDVMVDHVMNFVKNILNG